MVDLARVAASHGRWLMMLQRGALLLVTIAVGLCSAAAVAQEDWSAMLHSPRAADREAALLNLGDAGLAHPSAMAEAVRLLEDPIAAVRWNAIAALQKAGSSATPLLLARLPDRNPSIHVGSYFAGCTEGTRLLHPTQGEFVAAALATLPEIDADLMWSRFLVAEEDERRLLQSVLSMSSVSPPLTVVRSLHTLSEANQLVVLDLIDRTDTQALQALEAVFVAVGPELPRALERGIAGVLVNSGVAGLAAATRRLPSSPYPEEWFAAALPNPGAMRLLAPAFREAALSRRPEAMKVLAAALANMRWERGLLKPEERAAQAWLVMAGRQASQTFLAQPVPTDAEAREKLVGAAIQFVPVSEVRPALIDLLLRLLKAANDESWIWYILVSRLADSLSPQELQTVWSALEPLIRAAPPRKTSDGHGRKRVSAMDYMVSALPPPAPVEQPTLAKVLISAILQGKLSTFALPAVRDTAFGPEKGRLDSWRAALLRAVPATADPGEEVVLASLLTTLDAPAPLLERALRDVDAAPTVAARDAAQALRQLAQIPESRTWAVARLIERLRESTDKGAADEFAAALWEDDFKRESFPRSKEDKLEEEWQVLSSLPGHSPGRAAAALRLFSEVRKNAAVWVPRAAAVLGTVDRAADLAILKYLALAAPDDSAQPMPCEEMKLDNGEVLFLRKELRRYEGVVWSEFSMEASIHHRLAGALRPYLGEAQTRELAVSVWRGFNLPADATVDELVERMEIRFQAQCPIVETQATLLDLRTTLALPNGHPDKPQRFEEVLKSRSEAVACAAVNAIPSVGEDAVPALAAVLSHWLPARQSAYGGAHIPLHRKTKCDHDHFIEIFVKRLRMLPAERRRDVLRQALALESRPLTKVLAGARLDRRAQPAWNPSDLEAEASILESHDDWDSAVPETMLTAIDGELDDVLLERAQAGHIDSNWIELARAHWLRSDKSSRNREGEIETNRTVDPRARLALPLLAQQWPFLTSAQRARLLAIVSVADADDAAARAMIEYSVEIPTAGERLAALRVAFRLWPDDARWPPLKHAETVARAMAKRLNSRLNQMFQRLSPPPYLCPEKHSGTFFQRKIPWPPPAGYLPPEPIDLAWFGPAGATAGTWFKQMRKTFQALSPDYYIGLFGGPPGGFALVGRLERIDVSGRPFPGRARWTAKGGAKFDLADLLGDLFLERPGYFRIVVFVVTDKPTFDPGPAQHLPQPVTGAQSMPAELESMPLRGKHLLALVYSFERRQGESMHIWTDGAPSTLHHLKAAGLWEHLQPSLTRQ